jgi:excinuclease UvrABC nuclease subunit
MAKKSFTYYYVQAKKEDEIPKIVYHTHNKEYGEYYHRFFDKKKANALAKAENKIKPEVKFRVVKCTKTYEAEPWCLV